MPLKYKDPGCPTIPYVIGNTHIDKALLDLGASVNLVPYSVYQQLGVGELKPTRCTLQLADRSVKIPKGEVEDVLIKVGEFIFPVDFIVLETQPVSNLKSQIPVILGRPFLATLNALINCRTGQMKLSFGNMTVDLNIFNLGRQPSDPSDEPMEVNFIQGISSEQQEGECESDSNASDLMIEELSDDELEIEPLINHVLLLAGNENL